MTRRLAASTRCALLALTLIACLVVPGLAHANSQVEFGIEQEGGMPDPARRPSLLDAEASLGVKLKRYIFHYNEIATCDPRSAAGKGVSPSSYTNPCYAWGVPDAVVVGAQIRGMRVLGTTWGTPPWMFNDAPKFTGTTDAQYSAFLAVYSDFVQAAATRYDGKHGLPRVNQWTVWNEPNGSFFEPRFDANKKPIGPARYARMYDIASRRIKAVDSTLVVAVGPTAPHARSFPPVTYIKQLLPFLQAAGSPIDAWAHNAYIGGQNPYSTTMQPPYVGLGNLQDITGMLDRYPVTRDKPIWVTEFGYQTGGIQKVVTQPEQAFLTNVAMMYAWQHARISTFIWYSLLDDKDTGDLASFQTGLYMNETTGCGGTGSRICEKAAANSYRRPLVISKVSGGMATIWAMSQIDAATAKVYIQRPGEGWRTFRSADTSTTGVIYERVAMPVGTQVQVCDTRCSAIQTVAAGNDPTAPASGIITQGGGTSGTSAIIRQRAITLRKSSSLRGGIGFDHICSTCTVGSIIYARGAASGIPGARTRTIVVARAKVTTRGSTRHLTLRFTKSARTALSKAKRPRLVIRTVVIQGGRRTTYDRPVTLV